MENKRIAQFFTKNSLYLRPASLHMILPEFRKHPDEAQFLANLLNSIQSILIEKNMLSAMYIEPDIAQEALYILNQKKMEIEQGETNIDRPLKIDKRMPMEGVDGTKDPNDQVLMPNLIILNNFDSKRLWFEDKSRKIVIKESSTDLLASPLDSFFVEKYAFLRFLIEKAGKYYFEQKVNEKLSGKEKITEIGSLKGQKSVFTIFGVIYRKQGQFYMQDNVSEVKLNFQKTSKAKGYFGVGSFALIEGENKESSVEVLRIKYPEINSNICNEKHYLLKLAFYDSLNNDLKTLKLNDFKLNLSNGQNEINAISKGTNEQPIDVDNEPKNSKHNISEIYHLNQQYDQFKDDCEIVVINDFRMVEESIKNLEKVICEFYGRGILAFFICGSFFEANTYNSKNSKAVIKRNLKLFEDLLKKYQELLKSVRIFLVPAVEDFGLVTFPKQSSSGTVWSKLIGNFKNLSICQNPCQFMILNKSFTISKLNVINKAVRTCIVPIDGSIEPYEHLQSTLLGQRDFMPFTFQEYPIIPKLRSKLLMHELPDYMIFADDFAAPNTSKYSSQNSEGFTVFPGSFVSFGNYTVIKPLLNSIEFKYLF
jgi:hypothetical protein